MDSNVKQVLDDFGKRVSKLAKINVGAYRTVNGKRRRIDNSGDLRKSINYNTTVSKSGKSFEFNIVMEDYGENVDQGRKPGKGIPPTELYKWIKSKPIRLRDLETNSFVKTTESGIRSLAYLINRKIKEKGIAATNFLSDPFNEEFKELPDDVIDAFGLDVEQFLEFSLDELNKDYKE